MAILQKIKSRKVRGLAPDILPDILPAVSIIVPAYNEEVNAVKTIENLLQQNYPHFNIVFVDDGSKDSTYQRVLEAFGGHNQVKVLTKANGGRPRR